MSRPTSSTLDWEGQTVLDRTGRRVGTIEEIFLVEETGRPQWGLVTVGGDHATLVPLTGAIALDAGISVPYDRSAIADAPGVEPGAEPDQGQVDALYRHFEIDGGGAPAGGVAGPTNGSGNGAVCASQSRPRPSPPRRLRRTAGPHTAGVPTSPARADRARDVVQFQRPARRAAPRPVQAGQEPGAGPRRHGGQAPVAIVAGAAAAGLAAGVAIAQTDIEKEKLGPPAQRARQNIETKVKGTVDQARSSAQEAVQGVAGAAKEKGQEHGGKIGELAEKAADRTQKRVG